jgi:threonine/homoserine/homoserine lactone efflux protein
VKVLQRTGLGTQRHPKRHLLVLLRVTLGLHWEDLSGAVDLQHVPAFVAASTILMFIPGVDMALVTRQVVTQGRRAAIATLGGLLLGGLTHTGFATLGLSAVLLTSAAAYTTIKLLGAAYLVAIGIQTIWASWRRANTISSRQSSTRTQQKPMSIRHAFVLGFLSNVTNPKVAIFFLTFLPQFVSSGGDAAFEIALLGVLFNVIATTWWIGYVFLLDRASEWLRRSTVRRVIENVTGAVLVALGVRVAFERR